MKTAIASEIVSAAALHVDVLDKFITVVQDKLAVADEAFTRDSLTDLLANLTDQRDTYLTLATPMMHVAV